IFVPPMYPQLICLGAVLLFLTPAYSQSSVSRNAQQDMQNREWALGLLLHSDAPDFYCDAYWSWQSLPIFLQWLLKAGVNRSAGRPRGRLLSHGGPERYRLRGPPESASLLPGER